MLIPYLLGQLFLLAVLAESIPYIPYGYLLLTNSLVPGNCTVVIDCGEMYFPRQITVSEDESVVTGIDLNGYPLIVQQGANYVLSQTLMKRMTTCTSNQIAALDYQGRIYFLLMQPFEWIYLQTNITVIDIDCESENIWVIDEHRDLRKWENNNWNIKGSGFDSVFVGNGTVWALSSGIPFTLNQTDSSWTRVNGLDNIKEVAISSTAVIARNIMGELFYYKESWKKLDGYWTGLDVGATNMFVTTANGHVFTLSLEYASTLSVPSDNIDNQKNGWTDLPFNFTIISVAKDQTLFCGLDPSGAAFSVDLQTNKIEKMGDIELLDIVSCSIYAKYKYWAVDKKGFGYYWDQGEWVLQKNIQSLKQMDCDQTNVVALTVLGSTFSFSFETGNWSEFGEYGFDKIVVSAGTYSGLRNGILYNYVNSKWYTDYYNILDFQKSVTGTVIISDDHQIYQSTTSTYRDQHWQFTLGNLTRVSIASDTIFGVDIYGKVWKKKVYPSLDVQMQQYGWKRLSTKEAYFTAVAVSADDSIVIGTNYGGSAFLYDKTKDEYVLLGNQTFKQISACGIGAPFIAAGVDSFGNFSVWASNKWETFAKNINQVDCNERGIWAINSDGAVVHYDFLAESWITLPNETYANAFEIDIPVHFSYVTAVGNDIYALVRYEDTLEPSAIVYFDDKQWKYVYFPYEPPLASSYLSISSKLGVTSASFYPNLTLFNRTTLPGQYNYASVSDNILYSVDLTGNLWIQPINIPGPFPTPQFDPSIIKLVRFQTDDGCLNEWVLGDCGKPSKIKITPATEQSYYSLFTIEYTWDNQCAVTTIVGNIDVSPCMNFPDMLPLKPSMLWTVIDYQGYVLLQNYEHNLCILEYTMRPCIPIFKRTVFYRDAFASLPATKDIVVKDFKFKSNGFTGQAPFCQWIGPEEHRIQVDASFEYECLSKCNEYARNPNVTCTAYNFDFNLRKCYFYGDSVQLLYLTSSKFSNCGFILNIMDSLDNIETATSYSLFLLSDFSGMLKTTTINDVTIANACQVQGAPFANSTGLNCVDQCKSDPKCASFDFYENICFLYDHQLGETSIIRAAENSTQCGFVNSRNLGCEAVNNITVCTMDTEPKMLSYNSYLLASRNIVKDFPLVEGNCTFLAVEPYTSFKNSTDCSKYCVVDDDCTSFLWDPNTTTCSLFQNQLEFNNVYPTDSKSCGFLLARNPDCAVIDSSIVCKRSTISSPLNIPKVLNYQNKVFEQQFSFNYLAKYCMIAGESDWHTFNTTYYDLCLNLCDKNPGCTAFSYNMYTYRCDLFSLPLQYLQMLESANTYCGFSIFRNSDCALDKNTFSCPTFTLPTKISVSANLYLESPSELYSGSCNLIGVGYRHLEYFSYEHCSRYCSADDDCLSFEWDPLDKCVFFNSSLSLSSFSIDPRAPNCFVASDSLICNTSPNRYLSYNVTLNGLPLNTFQLAIQDDTVYFSGCRYYADYLLKFYFTKWEECQYLCESTKGCLSFSWAPYGNCWLFQDSFEMLIPVNTHDEWKCGFIATRNSDHCQFQASSLNCTTPFSPTRNITIQINGTKTTVQVNNSQTTFGPNTPQLFNFNSNNFENSSLGVANLDSSISTNQEPQDLSPTLISTKPKPTSSPTKPNFGNAENHQIVYIIAGTCFAIIIVVCAMFAINARKKVNGIEDDPVFVLYPGLSMDTTFDHTKSGNLKFASRKAAIAPTNQSMMLQFNEINNKLGIIPIDSYVWKGETIYIFSDIEGLPIFEELAIRFLFPLGTFTSELDVKELGIKVGDRIEIANYISADYFVTSDTEKPLIQRIFNKKKRYPISLIPTTNFPKLVFNILQTRDARSKLLDKIVATYPSNVRVNYLDTWTNLNPDEYTRDGIWNSILEDKSILIHADADNTVVSGIIPGPTLINI
ncbi:hypothetical protein HK103_007658 [Boothiomyces macroporosus]|uniref:Apple domain-containing protein n=1 Tax=Boothiomyces macroporosus TaxID=261099 RepID=A0AAD5UFK5_9FUNG|nr:hypothetical protein HK103_007658 [Boothiomyces macroporosus]